MNHPIDTATANIIKMANNSKAGVWATSESYARGLCEWPNAYWDTSHRMSEGFFPHFHPNRFPDFHCWYLG